VIADEVRYGCAVPPALADEVRYGCAAPPALAVYVLIRRA